MNALLLNIWAAVSANLQLVQLVLQHLGLVARQATADSIALQVDQSKVVLLQVQSAVDNLQLSIDAFRAESVSNELAIITAISDLPQTGDPVTLPTTPPAGYGSPELTDLANAVWNYAQDILPSTPGDALRQVARSVNSTASYDFFMDEGIFKVAAIEWQSEGIYITNPSFPTFDPTDIVPGETLLDCLTRQNANFNCSYPWGPQTYVGLRSNEGKEVVYITRIDEADFVAYQRNLAPLVGGFNPPVWPGVANVILGSPVAIDRGVTITEPMDGVIVNITAVPAKTAYFTFDDVNSYRNIGAVVFVSDDGEEEYAQSLNFANAVYSPRSMVQAAGVKLRSTGGVTGTITPWVIA